MLMSIRFAISASAPSFVPCLRGADRFHADGTARRPPDSRRRPHFRAYGEGEQGSCRWRQHTVCGLNPLYIYPPPSFKNDRQRQAYNRLVANVKKVLPIAKEVNAIIIETYEYLRPCPRRKREEHLGMWKSIRREYTPRMKKLSYQQGKLLIKLVYRECNSSSYQLIRRSSAPSAPVSTRLSPPSSVPASRRNTAPRVWTDSRNAS